MPGWNPGLTITWIVCDLHMLEATKSTSLTGSLLFPSPGGETLGTRLQSWVICNSLCKSCTMKIGPTLYGLLSLLLQCLSLIVNVGFVDQDFTYPKVGTGRPIKLYIKPFQQMLLHASANQCDSHACVARTSR